MNNIHPSEKEIQQYAIDKTECSPGTIGHMESCAHCKVEVSSYRVLFAEIKKSPKPVFDFDLSALVLPQLPGARPTLSADRFIAGFLVIFTGSCISIPAWLFRIYILNFFSGIPSFFIYAIVISASIFLSVKVLGLYKKFQQQMRLLNYN
jgi:hypothetical protein